MKVRTAFERARFLLTACCLGVAWLLSAAPAADAQALAPYVLTDCEVSPTFPIANLSSICDAQQQFNAANNVPMYGNSVAVTPDGTRVFVGFPFLIESFQRNTTTGELTFESCVEDGAPDAPTVTLPCTKTVPYTIESHDEAGTSVFWLSVSPDGNTLYASTKLQLSVWYSGRRCRSRSAGRVAARTTSVCRARAPKSTPARGSSSSRGSNRR